jgi:hypothetical protein
LENGEAILLLVSDEQMEGSRDRGGRIAGVLHGSTEVVLQPRAKREAA